MSRKAMEPFGLALKDFFEGNEHAKIIFHRDDGLKEESSLLSYFRSESSFTLIEKQALALCRGKILDIGAGAGPHSLALQRRGFEVTAIDISPHACKIMMQRGIKKVKCSSVYELKEEKFDTILLMGRSIGIVETLSGLRKFLIYCKNLLNPMGLILFDSIDVRLTNNPIHMAYQEDNIKQGRYFGEIRLQIEYKDILGEKFQFLRIDPQTLKDIVFTLDWSCEILYKEKNGSYLVKIFK